MEARGLYRPVAVSIASHVDGEVAVRGIPDGSEVVVEGAYFVKIDLMVIPETAFHGASRVVVLNSVGQKSLQAAVIHFDWDLDPQRGRED